MGLAAVLADAHLLIIDDEQFSRSIICRHLRDLGNPGTIQATDGAQGLAELLVPEREIAAVITDFAMPSLDGLQFLKCVRTGMAGIRRDLPILMLTGHADQDILGRAMALDVDAFVVKPASKAILEARLTRVLAEPFDLKPVAFYQQIVVDSSPEDPPVFQAVDAQSDPFSGMPLPLEEVIPPVVLARDIIAPSGELLLSAGTAVSPRLLQRLRELRGLGILVDTIYVQ